MKLIRYAVEGILIQLIFIIFGLLKPEMSSAIGGWIGRNIGPKLAASRKANRNIENALPELSAQERKQIIAGMWDNLGRVMAEYPHLEKLAINNTTIYGLENLNLSSPSARVFIGGHFANWELYGASALLKVNIPLDLTYRAPNNPWTASLLEKSRSLNGRLRSYPKSRESGRLILECLKQGRSLGILIDQKYNEGIEVPFFNLPAMTNPIFVQLCQKYKCPLYPIQIRRRENCAFEIIVHPQIPVFDAHGNARDVAEVILEAHALLEGWIRENPEHWLWLHRRWKT